MELSLTTRLLCAADHAYALTKDGPAPDSSATYNPIRSSLVGYSAKAAGFCAGIKDINAVLVGETAQEIVVAFRGTLSPIGAKDRKQVALDWMHDLNAPLVADPAKIIPGFVHKGFLDALNTLWDELSKALKPLLQNSPNKPLLITGHSKGGALANLAAIKCHRTLGAKNIQVCTFAGARAGDPNFSYAYNIEIPNSRRFEYQDDIVPHLPPSDVFGGIFKLSDEIQDTINKLHFGYESVGHLQFIDWNNAIQANSENSMPLKLERYGRLALQFTPVGFAKIINDHSIDPGYYGYISTHP